MASSGKIHFLCAVTLAVTQGAAFSQQISRGEVLRIAESYVNHRWTAGAGNIRHGKDASGVEIHTPDRAGGRTQPIEAGWTAETENIGVPYKWGGFDSLARFDAGIKNNKAGGDVYTAEKRRLGGAAVSSAAVGIDCSGFISRCWNLSNKHSTSMLFGICDKLGSPGELLPGDIMNTAEGHVLLFVKWMDTDKTRALFYEAAPFSKTMASEHDVSAMASSGYQPLRYRRIRD